MRLEDALQKHEEPLDNLLTPLSPDPGTHVRIGS